MSRTSNPGPVDLDLAGLRCEVDTWLTQTAHFPCYNVKGIASVGESVTRHDAVASFFSAKVDVRDVTSVNALLRRGFHLVDTALTLRVNSQHVKATEPTTPRIDLSIYEAGPDEVDAVATIAQSAFRFSRFHIDPHFPAEAADRIKSEWARNLASGERGSGCLIARRAERVVAFLGYVHVDEPVPVAVIDLIAVDSAIRGVGVGAAIVSTLLTKADEQGRAVLVGTQAGNSGSVRLYENLGFRLDSASYVLHGHQLALGIA